MRTKIRNVAFVLLALGYFGGYSPTDVSADPYFSCIIENDQSGPSGCLWSFYECEASCGTLQSQCNTACTVGSCYFDGFPSTGGHLTGCNQGAGAPYNGICECY